MAGQVYDKDADWYAAAEPVFASDVSKSLIPNPPVHDVASRRQNADKMYSLLFPPASPSVPVDIQQYETTSFDGVTIGILAFFPQTSEKKPSPAVVYAHGGGMISLHADTVQNQTARLAADGSVPFFSVDYRLAPESPHPAPTEDVFHAVVWLQTAAKAGQVFGNGINIDPARIAVAGESAGGGIAAGVALMARDRKLNPPLAKQILWYPMLDHRTTSESQIDARLLPHLTWSLVDNVTGWSALLGRDVSSAHADIYSVPGLQYASPARASSLGGLPPTYMDTGFLDLFHDEIVEYGRRCSEENGTQPLELHIYPGLPHGFDGLARDTPTVKKALDLRVEAIRALWN
ncbi:hypothetical protein SEUCBS139899_007478 [Sporothrix eucalyptigena]|uniref:Alpha/beta hydrolase fold-3 domain-containing protein n=1 Tax=Sporothrix eucalyptigena TaxID=1812306 RepID=A0ABP0C9D2_9PEZI